MDKAPTLRPMLKKKRELLPNNTNLKKAKLIINGHGSIEYIRILRQYKL